MKKLINFIPLFVIKQEAFRPILLSRNITLSFKIVGEGTHEPAKPPIFIFHGLLGNRKQWEGIGKTIVNITHRTVVTVDLRNHGLSPHGNTHQFTHQAADIIQLLEKLGVKQASLMGHSMGGRTAMCTALMAPQLVAGLLVVDMSPKTNAPEYTSYFLKIMESMYSLTFDDYKELSKARTEVRKYMKGIIEDEHLVETVMHNLRRKRNGKIGWICNLEVLIKDYEHWVSFPKCLTNKRFDGPTLFLGGQLSDFVQPDDLPYIRELFPRAVVIYVPKTKHYVHLDDPKTFLELTIAFLRTNSYRDEPPVAD